MPSKAIMAMEKARVKALKEGKVKFGRPTKYKPEYCELMVEFFSQEVVGFKETKHYDRNGQVARVERTPIPIFFPTFQRFAARTLGVDMSTLALWRKVHKEFSGAYTRAEALQQSALLEYTMNGLYSERFAQFLAINNMGMVSAKTEAKDTGEMELTHKYEDLDDDQLAAALKARNDRRTRTAR